jgi:O-antigen/teichoic acid export membrane protein
MLYISRQRIRNFSKLYQTRTPDARLFSNVTWTFLGNTFYTISQWGMIVVLARCTTPAAVGTLALALAITAPVMTLFNMQLRIVVATDVTGRYRLADYIHTRLVTTVAAVAAIALCTFVPIGRSSSTAAVVILVALSKAVESVSDVLHGHWQRAEHMEVVGKSLLIRGILSIAIFTISVVLTRSVAWGAASLLLGSLGVLLLYDVNQVRRVPACFGSPALGSSPAQDVRSPGGQVRSIIRRAAPLGIVAMLIALNSAIPRYFIEIYCGKHSLGIFSALSYFIVAGNLVVNAIGQSAVPRLAALYYLPKHTQFKQMLAALLTVSLGLSALSLLCAVMFGRQILSVYGREYASSYNVFLTIMGIASIGYFVAVFNYTLNAIGAYKVQVPLFLAVTGVLFLFCSLSVPAGGINGAALSLLGAGMIQAVASGSLLAWRLRTQEA